MIDAADWYKTLTEDERFERFGYRPWWVVFGGHTPSESRYALATANPPIDQRPGFLSDSTNTTVEHLCAALDAHQRRLDLWCCVFTREGWRFVFSNDTDAMVARLLL